MTALSFSVSPVVSTPPPAAAALAATARPAPDAPDVERRSQVSPESSVNVTTGTIAAIQQLGGGEVSEDETTAQAAQAKAAEPKSFEEIQAEARRWERYYSHQPRRLADLLAVYYGGGQQASLDPRGPAPKPLVEYISRAPEITDETNGGLQPDAH
jgi:hypothetical protein